MPLNPGTKLGPYEIQSALGAGGMGEVYRALDTRLNRTVAVKILAARLSSSPELRQRLDREARAISSLNHPHICQLYDIGSQGGTEFLVMEFLEGETLADRLKKGTLPLNEILKIGTGVAEALAVAHHQGIVHRDLKPGNIMLTQAGPKLMDFGLAKPLGVASAGSSSAPPSFTAAATLSGPSPLTPLTTAGTIIGTIQYMSPEQIEGKEADARSDIFAFGAVLYEMAAGKRPFEGKSQISLASSILEKDPDPISTIHPQTPPAFDHVVTTCLQKNPDDRFQTAHDIKLELQWIASGKFIPARATQPAPPAPKPNYFPWIAAVIAALVLGTLSGTLLRRPSPGPSLRTVIDPPPNTSFRLTDDTAGPPVLSPDGATLAFAASGSDGKIELWMRPMNTVDAHAIPDTSGAIFPFWSPDSKALGFFAEGKLKTVDLNGGSSVVVCDAQLGRGGSWGPDGTILFSEGPVSPIFRVNASGGTPVAVTKIDSTQHTSHRWPYFLPGGKHFLYLAIHHDNSKAPNDAIYYASIDGRENRFLLRSQANAIYANGFLLFARGDQLMAQPFDPGNGKLSGEPQGVARGVFNDATTWHMDTTAAENGLLVFGSGGSGDIQLIWMDRGGKQIGTAAEKLNNLQYASLSPQGDRIAMGIDTGINDIWILDLTRGVRTKLTFGPIANRFPVWSPDGKWIAYQSDRNGHPTLFRKPSDGSGVEELLLTDEAIPTPTGFTPDGKTLLYMRGLTAGANDLWALPLEGDRKPQLLVPHGYLGRVSPDGHWLAYESLESGVPEVYVMAFGGGQGKWQVSPTFGQFPLWSSDGKELYYFADAQSLVAVSVTEVAGVLQFGAAQTLVNRWTILTVPFYNVSPDRKRILLERLSQTVNPSVTVVTNFAATLHH